MDDLQLLKEMRRSTPALTEDVREATRGLLMTGLATGGVPPVRRRRPRFALRAIVAGGLVATAAAAITVGVGHRQTGVGGMSVANAQELGDDAARVVSRQTIPTPGPAQWAYTKRLDVSLEEVNPKGVTYRHVYDEDWIRGDGKRHADILHFDQGTVLGKGSLRPGALETFPVDGQSLAANSSLPTDPDALLKWAEKPTYAERHPDPAKKVPGVSALGTPSSRAADALQGLLESRPPAKLAAAAFRALARIPGITAQRDAVDALGRHGVAFALDEDGERFEIIVDPTTYRYLGWTTVVLAGNTSMGGMKPGAVDSSSAAITYAIVDHAGQRP